MNPIASDCRLFGRHMREGFYPCAWCRFGRWALLCVALGLVAVALACAPTVAAGKVQKRSLRVIATERVGLAPMASYVTVLLRDPGLTVRSCPWVVWTWWLDGAYDQTSAHELHCGPTNTGRFSDYQNRCLDRAGTYTVQAVVTAEPAIMLRDSTTIQVRGLALSGCP